MTSVSRKEGFRYGFYIFAYWLALLVFGAALVAAGWLLIQEPGRVDAVPASGARALGGFVAFLGVLVFGAGQTGLVYKVVADGVETGVVARGAGNGHPSASATDEGDQPVTGATQPRQPEGPAEPTTSGPADVPGESGPEPTTEPVATDDGQSVEAETTEGPGLEPEPGTGDPVDDPGVGTAGESGADASHAEDEFEAAGFEPSQPETDETDAASQAESETRADRGESATGPPADSHPDAEAGDEAEPDETPAGDEAEPDETPAGDEAVDSPADVASESGIAEELGFDGDENGDATAGTADGDEPADDPLAPDSDFAAGDPAPDRTTDESTVPLTDDATTEDTEGGDATTEGVDVSDLFGGTESTGETTPADAETDEAADDEPLMATDDDSADGDEGRASDAPDRGGDTDDREEDT